MGFYLIKANKDEDFYVEWSSYEDHAIAYGTWQEFVNENPEVNTQKRFERLQEFGTSHMLRDDNWDEEEIIVRNVGLTPECYSLRRKDLKNFVIEYFEADPDMEKAQAVLEKYCTVAVFED